MKKTIKPIIRTITEFIILPPCGHQATFDILMNSPHPILFSCDAPSPPLKSTPPFLKGERRDDSPSLYSND
jgi:hypothetical protein